MEDLLKEFDEDELGTVENFTMKLTLKVDAQPKFFRPRPIPFALKEAVEQELDRLETDNIIEKVSHYDWAAPIVAVPKKNGRMRICGDYKVTINPVRPIPATAAGRIFATLAGGKKFTTLDLSQAYSQVLLDETSSGYVTIIHKRKCLYNNNYVGTVFTRLEAGDFISFQWLVNKTRLVIKAGFYSA